MHYFDTHITSKLDHRYCCKHISTYCFLGKNRENMLSRARANSDTSENLFDPHIYLSCLQQHHLACFFIILICILWYQILYHVFILVPLDLFHNTVTVRRPTTKRNNGRYLCILILEVMIM